MSWENIISEYPWLDIALEIFKGVMPTVIAILTIYITQWQISKRESKNKKKDKKFEYHETVLKWLIVLKTSFTENTHLLYKILVIRDPEEKIDKYNNFLRELSKINIEFFSWIDTYDAILCSWKSDIGLKNFKMVYKSSSDRLIAISTKYLQDMDEEKLEKEINATIKDFKTAMDKVIEVLTYKMGQIY